MQNRYALKIREGKVVEFLVNGREADPLLDREGRRNLAEERRRRESYDIDGLFDVIDELVAQDRSAGRTNFTRARFDKTDGHLLYYQRQVAGKQQQQIQVDLKQISAGSGP